MMTDVSKPVNILVSYREPSSLGVSTLQSLTGAAQEVCVFFCAYEFGTDISDSHVGLFILGTFKFPDRRRADLSFVVLGSCHILYTHLWL